MILSFWPNKEYPILYEPTDSELIQFSEQENWDTLRINCTDKVIAVASGHGNTHQSISDMCKDLKWCDTHIIFREDGGYWYNLEAASMKGRKVRYHKRPDLFTPRQVEILQTLVELRG